MAAQPTLLEIRCNTAEEVLGHLTRLTREPTRGEARADRWLWRGQREAKWELVPSALRPGELLGYQHRSQGRTVTGNDLRSTDQHQAEFYAVAEFVYLADEIGLHIPGDTALFRHTQVASKIVGASFGRVEWPPPELLEAMALAQHHGVPTRLLDFSYRREVGAWFAVSHPEGTGDEYAIWGIDFHCVVMTQLALYPGGAPIARVTAPRAFNRYLHAQHGLFLVDRFAGDDDDSPPQLNRAIAQMTDAARARNLDDQWVPMVKLIAPRESAERLRHLLALDGYDEAHLKPSLDNVVGELKARRAKTIASEPFANVRAEPG